MVLFDVVCQNFVMNGGGGVVGFLSRLGSTKFLNTKEFCLSITSAVRKQQFLIDGSVDEIFRQ